MAKKQEVQKKEYAVKAFKTPEAFNVWLKVHHVDTPGVWLKFYKKAPGIISLNYDQALDEALCYGWIDSQTKKYDEVSYLQKFTPRRSKSIWSKINRDHITRLIKAKRMQPAGLAQVKAAKTDGRWDAAYDSPANMTISEEFLSTLAKNKKASLFFETLSKSNTYAIGWRIATAKKPETKAKRIKTIIEMLENGETFH